MNRTIKFRAWDKQRNIFVESKVLCLLILEGQTILAYNTKQGAYCIPDTGQENLGVNRFVLQQYTGLKDKNGREIFEGDIVKYCGYSDISYALPAEVSIGEYSTHANTFLHYGVRAKRIDMDLYFGIGGESGEYEVIGNIFENPELLK